MHASCKAAAADSVAGLVPLMAGSEHPGQVWGLG